MLSIKEQLEILRGEPIRTFTGDPKDIPCIETSDPEMLCKYPVVSVHMITYNHEPYIRQAIEGVMMQKTDFEFELVIGEDASTDKTREICFEYQKKYPDKIRVLWSEKNLYQNQHPAGGNSRRVSARCRGEFIALCEGDDYWIDPLKLQKQVDVMRKYPNVGLCFCGSKIFWGESGRWEEWNPKYEGFAPGLIPSRKYLLYSMFGRNPHVGWGPEFFQMTATMMARASVLREARERYDLFSWRLRVGDGRFSMGCGSLSDVYYLPDVVSVYRRMSTGASIRDGAKGFVDTLIIRIYYWAKVFGLPLRDIPERVRRDYYDAISGWILRNQGREALRKYVLDILLAHSPKEFFDFPNLHGRLLVDRLCCRCWLTMAVYYWFNKCRKPCGLSQSFCSVYIRECGSLSSYPIGRESTGHFIMRKLFNKKCI